MRRVELLIDMARKQSGNTRYDADSGVPQDVFVQMLNNAQDSLTMRVNNIKGKFWKMQEIVPVVSGQIVYPYPVGCYLQNIDTVSWSLDGKYYTPMDKLVTKEEVSTIVGYAFGYIPYHDGIHLNPPIGFGSLKITYIFEPCRLQKRAGQLSAVSLAGQVLTGMSVNIAEASYDSAEINLQNTLCVVGRDGLIKAKNIPYTSQMGGVFTMGSVTLSIGQTVAVGDYICIGENAGNIPVWPNICEGYLLKNMIYEAKYGDSSMWTKEATATMDRYFAELSASFASLSDDITEIPITNCDYLGL